MDSTNVVASAAQLYWCVLLKVLALYLSATYVDHTCLRWTRITSDIAVSSNTAVSVYKP
jgi:hypothetical protein